MPKSGSLHGDLGVVQKKGWWSEKMPSASYYPPLGRGEHSAKSRARCLEVQTGIHTEHLQNQKSKGDMHKRLKITEPSKRIAFLSDALYLGNYRGLCLLFRYCIAGLEDNHENYIKLVTDLGR